ncbi:hypothetical protein [Clostridium sp.]|uniref:hypothetical protein n=1 Tax=Clostridium sp. TaxID=1506 RepID=UPI001EBF4483|nr:hypothetical protein [Clostridium sp.]MBS5885157.1 hypothetical protein [Clostridium sp.]
MSQELIKGVGKKLNIDDNSIKVSKTIGKEVTIKLKDIVNIDYEEGTMSKNGLINIKWNENGKLLKENFMFRCFSNDIVKELVNGVNRFLEDTSKGLNIEEKEKVGVFQQLNKESREQIETKVKSKQVEKEKLIELENKGIPYCPKCKSTSLTTTNKKLSLGRAAVGGALLGGTGAVLGGLTSKKIDLVCMNCGHKFKLGKK